MVKSKKWQVEVGRVMNQTIAHLNTVQIVSPDSEIQCTKIVNVNCKMNIFLIALLQVPTFL